jgi:hypothetical protein
MTQAELKLWCNSTAAWFESFNLKLANFLEEIKFLLLFPFDQCFTKKGMENDY